MLKLPRSSSSQRLNSTPRRRRRIWPVGHPFLQHLLALVVAVVQKRIIGGLCGPEAGKSCRSSVPQSSMVTTGRPVFPAPADVLQRELEKVSDLPGGFVVLFLHHPRALVFETDTEQFGSG